MKCSLMTMTMFLYAAFKYQMDSDREGFLELCEEMFQMAQKAGYQSLDVCSMETGMMSVEYMQTLMKKYDMAISSYIYLDQCGDDGENALQAVDTAKQLGAQVLMLAPQWADTLNDLNREQIHDLLVNRWQPVVEKARAQGLKVVIENTQELCFHSCKAADVRALLERLEGAELVYDCGNVILVEEDPASYCEHFADKIGYVHLKDMRLASPGESYTNTAEDGRLFKGTATGTGLIDFTEVVQKLKEIGYQGRLSVEFYPKPDGDFQAALCEGFAYITELTAK